MPKFTLPLVFLGMITLGLGITYFVFGSIFFVMALKRILIGALIGLPIMLLLNFARKRGRVTARS